MGNSDTIMQNAQNTILDQLRAIPKGTEARFHLRRPDGSLFSHTSAIDLTRVNYPDGFDTRDCEVVLATPIDKLTRNTNPYWASYHRTPRLGVCAIVGIEPALPALETLQKWVEDGITVRIEYAAEDEITEQRIGPSPVTGKLQRVVDGRYGLVIQMQDWNLYLNRAKGQTGWCRPLVTSIAPVTEAVQTPEEIDTIMQRAAHEGTRVSAVTASGKTHIGDVLDSGPGDFMRYRVPAQGESIHEVWWLDADSDSQEERRIVSVRELPAEKQSEAEMLALLQAAERDGSHVEATMADGSKRAGAVTELETCPPCAEIPSGMVRCSIGGYGSSFGAKFDHERIASVKALPREEKRPDVQTYDPSKVTITIGSPSPLAGVLGFDGPFTISGGDTLTLTGERALPYSLATGNPQVTPTCCADVALYIGRRVRVEDGIEGILTGCGLDPDDDENWFGLDGETPHDYCDKLYAWAPPASDWTFELLPDEPAPSGNLMIAPTCPADLEPYIGRRVRVLAGEEREVVREGRLADATWYGHTSLMVEGAGAGWSYGPGSSRSTLVEVLPELQDAQHHASDDEAEPAPFAPTLRFGTFIMAVDGEVMPVTLADGILSTKNGRRVKLTAEGDETTGSIRMWETPALRGVGDSEVAVTVGPRQLTLVELLKLAPPPNDVRAFESFQETVRAAITTGLVTA